MFSVQGRFSRDRVKIEGESTEWTFPDDNEKSIGYRSCDSGGATYHFCPVCGTHIYGSAVEGKAAEFVGIRIGTANQRAALTPKRQIWCASALDWLSDIPALAAKEHG